ncbi:MAG: hypothetical protein V1844_04790 [Pseudomonadota bacterium]
MAERCKTFPVDDAVFLNSIYRVDIPLMKSFYPMGNHQGKKPEER